MDPNLNAAARCITALRTAIDLRDIALLRGALKFASTITFVDEEGVAIVRQATLTLSILEEHREQLRQAVRNQSVSELQAVLAHAQVLGVDGHDDELDAQDLLDELTAPDAYVDAAVLSPTSALAAHAAHTAEALSALAASRAREEEEDAVEMPSRLPASLDADSAQSPASAPPTVAKTILFVAENAESYLQDHETPGGCDPICTPAEPGVYVSRADGPLGQLLPLAPAAHSPSSAGSGTPFEAIPKRPIVERTSCAFM